MKQTDRHFLSHPALFILEWQMFKTVVIERLEIHILCSVAFFFLKSCRLWDKVEKYCGAGQAPDDDMTHAHCVLDTYGYKHTHTGCVIVTAFPLQQCLHELSSLLHYTYIARLP
jgi:hypothetical protein